MNISPKGERNYKKIVAIIGEVLQNNIKTIRSALEKNELC